MVVMLFDAILLFERILAVFSKKNDIKVYMQYHKGANFSHVVIIIAKISMTATSDVYQAHLYVSSQLIFVAQTRIFDFKNT